MKFLLTLSIFLGFFIFSSIAQAQIYAVKSISDYLPEYKEKHQLIIADLEKRTDLAHAQKYVMYQNDLSKLKAEFRAIRSAEYESKSIQLSVKNSCASESSSSVKDCGTKCLAAPSKDLYTQTDWLKIVGSTKGTSVSSTDSTACFRLTVMGKGSTTATLYATFKYKPEAISTLTDHDTNYLFTKVVLVKPEYLN